MHIICHSRRPVARLAERGVHVKNMQANLMHFKLSMLYLHHTRLLGGQQP